MSENFTVEMRIKTTAEEGLLFYASDMDDTYAFSIALSDGKVKVINTAGSDGKGVAKRNEVETMRKYNDGAWHLIEVTKEGLRYVYPLRLFLVL